MRLRQHFIAIAQHIAVVPAVLMEGVFDERCAHDVTYLPTIEPWTKLLHHLLGHHIALLDIDAINAGKAEVTAATDQTG